MFRRIISFLIFVFVSPVVVLAAGTVYPPAQPAREFDITTSTGTRRITLPWFDMVVTSASLGSQAHGWGAPLPLHGKADNSALLNGQTTATMRVANANLATTATTALNSLRLGGVLASGIPTNTSMASAISAALAAFTGTANIVTLGTIGAGTWHGGAIADAYIASGITWNNKVSTATLASGLAGKLGLHATADAALLATTATQAGHAATATHATTADYATSTTSVSSYAATAGHAATADLATTATYAAGAGYADTATHVLSAGTATTASVSLDAKTHIADVTGNPHRVTAAQVGAPTTTGLTNTVTLLHTELSKKENAITTGTTGQYWRGDKTWQTYAAGGGTVTAVTATAPLTATAGATPNIALPTTSRPTFAAVTSTGPTSATVLNATTSINTGAGAGTARIDNAGKGTFAGGLTVGAVTPSAWGSGFLGVHVGDAGGLASIGATRTGSGLLLCDNCYFDGSVFKIIATGASSVFEEYQGAYYIENAVSGTAGATAIMTEKLHIAADGTVNVNVGPFQTGGVTRIDASGNMTPAKVTNAGKEICIPTTQNITALTTRILSTTKYVQITPTLDCTSGLTVTPSIVDGIAAGDTLIISNMSGTYSLTLHDEVALSGSHVKGAYSVDVLFHPYDTHMFIWNGTYWSFIS